MGRNGNEVMVMSICDLDLPNYERRNGVKYYRAPRGSLFFRTCIKIVSRYRPGVIIVFNRPSWVQLFRETFPGATVILSLHSRRLGRRWLRRDTARQALHAATAIVTVSRSLARYVARFSRRARAKTYTIYSGVDTSVFRPPTDDAARSRLAGLRARLGVTDKTVVLYAGRLTRAKGVDLLMRAMERVTQYLPHAQLLVCGSNWIPSRRQPRFVHKLQLQASKLGDNITSVGFVPPPVMHEYFWAADILVSPSRFPEPLARVLYEGMATALPVVATARGGMPELVRHRRNGLLVRSTAGALSLARALAALIRNQTWAADLGQAGRRLVVARHRWSVVAARWESLMSKLVRCP